MVALSQNSRDEMRANRWLGQLKQQEADGRWMTDTERIQVFRDFVEAGNLNTTEPILPLLLNLRGRPYEISSKHFVFSPIFRTEMPKRMVLMTARQVSKSTSLASSGIVLSNSIPYSNSLFITPLFEQIRRFSTNYVGDFIKDSPVRELFSDSTTSNNVLQRTFRNFSKQIFSFAADSADRVRGITADFTNFDETQDLDTDNIAIIQEVMSASDWAVTKFTGTPKSLDNSMERYWQTSSQAEWIIKCYGCGHFNIPNSQHDLLGMIGEWHEDIGKERPAVVCSKCKKPIDPRLGRWYHSYPEKRREFAGYHVPQCILPMHYAKQDKWATLLHKQETLPPNMFYNEVLGESYDLGSKIVSETDLKNAAVLPWENNPKNPDPQVEQLLPHYIFRVLGIDWGGGGKEEVSYTTVALLGFRADGRIDCLWGTRLRTPHDHQKEALQIRGFIARFKPDMIAHDYTGAGSLRETFLIQAGVPVRAIMPVAYVRSASRNMVNYVPPSNLQRRAHYQADKTMSLLFTTNALKLGLLRFFKYDFKTVDDPGLMADFLALIDEKTETNAAGSIYMIKRQEKKSDDFAHAVNLGCLAIWHTQDAWPDFATLAGFAKMTEDQAAAAFGIYDPDVLQDAMGGFFQTP